MTEPTVQPDRWADIADELERIAKDVRGLVGQPAPGLVSLSIQPYNADRLGKPTAKGRPATVAAVDAVATALLGKPGATYDVSGGFHHGVHGESGPISVGVYTSVAAPDAVDPEEEIARLRAEVEQLRAAAATPAQLAAVAAKLRADQAAEPSCQGAPAGFETDCGISGGHGPHGPEPTYEPQFGEPGFPGCPGCGKTVGQHADGCAEDES
jgi:hypothetical protein